MSSDAGYKFTLSDGLLNDDLDHLDNQRFYPQKIILNSVNDFLRSINIEDQNITIPNNSSQMSIFCYRLIQSSRRGIHIVLKWLVYLHEVLNENQCLKILQTIYQGMSKLYIDYSFTCYSNYDKYLKKLLVKPYLQYLMKLTTLLIQQAQEKKQQIGQFNSYVSPLKSTTIQNSSKINQQSSYSNDNQENLSLPKNRGSPIQRLEKQTEPLIKFNKESSGNENKNWYQKYNLITFILEEFIKPINQFNGYFAQFYPYLNNFIVLIQNDIKAFYRIVKKQYSSNCNKQIQLISLIQMDRLSQKVSNFMKLGYCKRLQKSLFTQLQQIDFKQNEETFQNLLKQSRNTPLLQFQWYNQNKLSNLEVKYQQNKIYCKDDKQNFNISKKIGNNF